MTQTIVFATGNTGKFIWLEKALAHAGMTDWTVEMAKLDLLEVQSDSLEEISLFKARQAYELLKKPVLVMDGGFYITALNGFPGPFARYMFDQMGPENIARLASTLEDKSCTFRNVATYIESPDTYQQFEDNTGNIYSLSDTAYPHDHPQQWSTSWRTIIPSGFGYTKTLASFSVEELDAYVAQRAQSEHDNSCLNKFVHYLMTRDTVNTPKFGT